MATKDEVLAKIAEVKSTVDTAQTSIGGVLDLLRAAQQAGGASPEELDEMISALSTVQEDLASTSYDPSQPNTDPNQT